MAGCYLGDSEVAQLVAALESGCRALRVLDITDNLFGQVSRGEGEGTGGWLSWRAAVEMSTFVICLFVCLIVRSFFSYFCLFSCISWLVGWLVGWSGWLIVRLFGGLFLFFIYLLILMFYLVLQQ